MKVVSAYWHDGRPSEYLQQFVDRFGGKRPARTPGWIVTVEYEADSTDYYDPPLSLILGKKRIRQDFHEMWLKRMSCIRKQRTASCDESIVYVDRSVPPIYPDWVKQVMHPAIQSEGPDEYDLSKVGFWLHDEQRTGWIWGENLYDHINAHDMLSSCLGLRDGEEIRRKGVTIFRKFFAEKIVILWKSVVMHEVGKLAVPVLYEYGNEVVLNWFWLTRDYSIGHIAGYLLTNQT